MAQPMNKSLLQTRGTEKQFSSSIVGVEASRDGRSVLALTVDGEAILFSREHLQVSEEWCVLSAHDGALCCAQGCVENSFITGGEDGRVLEITAQGAVTELYKTRGWIDCIASTTKHWAFSSKKNVMVHKVGSLSDPKIFEHPSTVSGLSFDAKGRRLIASHYNGVSLWFVQAKHSSVRSLEWKGSHTGVCVHPNGDAVITSMQENEVHGWRLPDGHNMRMSGYPKKISSMSFTRNGKWLATSGADAAVLWPFFGGGPMGKAPTEVARLPGLFVTCVCAHPKEDLLAIGFEDGTVLLAEVGVQSDRILPLCNGKKSGGVERGAVTSIAFTPQGGAVVFGTEEGFVGAVDLSSKG